MDKTTCETILSGYTKASGFTKLNTASPDWTTHKQKFDIGWLSDFKWNFMDKCLDIEYTTADGTFHVYIPYDRILKINTSKTAVDIIIQH